MTDEEDDYQILEEGHKYEMWVSCVAVPIIDLAKGKVKIVKVKIKNDL